MAGKKEMIDIYCDGSTLNNQRPNKRRGGVGWVALRDDKRLCERSEFVGRGENFTNNLIEYEAVLEALQWREENAPDESATVYTDSDLVVNQVSGEWTCNADHLEPKITEVRDRLHPEDGVSVARDNQYIARAHDLAQSGAAGKKPPETSPSSRRRSTSSGSGGGVTEIEVEPMDEVPGPVDQPHPGIHPWNIPDELKRLPQWINWVPDKRNDKETKIPWQGWEYDTAKSNDPETFTDYETAVDAVGNRTPFGDGRVPGLGFVLTTGDPYCVIDLDDCRRGPGDIDQWAVYVIHSLESYCQVSVSGTGLHIFVKDATVPDSWTNKDDEDKEMEIYDWGRFITMTGHVYEDPFTEIASKPDFGEWTREIEDALYH